MKVLVIGSGGREHCLAWKLKQSPLADKIYCIPGNGGTSQVAENAVRDITNSTSLVEFSKKEKIDLVVVGSEAPLVGGIVDVFVREGIKIFGPEKDCAFLEGSKVYAKQIMKKYNIPTADFEIFDDSDKAKEYVKKRGAPLVIKADGLAAGKGVFVAASLEEAYEAIEKVMVKRQFGQAGERIVIEQCLEGEEASIIVITDGETILPLVSSQDHKRVGDNDTGPNTGGMGAYAPAPVVNTKVMEKILNDIFRPLIYALKNEGKRYKGVLYGGLMIKSNQPRVLEFNVRFGDPETQVILPKLKTDLVHIMLHAIDGTLHKVSLEWDERFCVGVVLASGGYPGKYNKGVRINGLENIAGLRDVVVFHAGTQKMVNSRGAPYFITSGGRVLNVVGLGQTLKEAQRITYMAVEKIHFKERYFRHDIGNKASLKYR